MFQVLVVVQLKVISRLLFSLCLLIDLRSKWTFSRICIRDLIDYFWLMRIVLRSKRASTNLLWFFFINIFDLYKLFLNCWGFEGRFNNLFLHNLTLNWIEYVLDLNHEIDRHIIKIQCSLKVAPCYIKVSFWDV